jgi:hypothetical protein
MRACQVPTQACHLSPEGTQRHRGRRVTRALSQHGQQERLNHPPLPDALVRHVQRRASAASVLPVGTTDPSLRIRPSTLCTCRSSMRQPLLRHW